MPVAAVNIYLCANALLVAAVFLLTMLVRARDRFAHPIASRHLLWIGHGLSLAALLLPFIRLSFSHSVMPATMQVWSASSMADIPRIETSLADHRLAVPFASAGETMPLSMAANIAMALFAMGVFALLVRVGMDVVAIVRIVVGAQTLRRARRIHLYVSDRVRAPFSFWVPGKCVVVLPSILLSRSRDLKMAIRHEVQHHRQHDTQWLYLYAFIKAVFFWNPAAHLLARRIQDLQEFTCDAAVVARKDISTRSYCESLVWAAEYALKTRRMVLSASMNGGFGRKILKRRVEGLLVQPTQPLRASGVFVLAMLGMGVMTMASLAFAATIQDRRISLEDVEKMVLATANRENGADAIKIAVNESVLKQLNRLASTPDGREFARAGLSRMREHEGMLSSKIIASGLPKDLLAVPLVESGYRNLSKVGGLNGAGLWMFIKPTARRFGLVVNERQDQRLDPSLETDAALRMLASLHARYTDWGLALLAYNSGNWRVDKGIRETGSRNVWEIIGKGYENDPDYVARVMAAMLILRNPSLID